MDAAILTLTRSRLAIAKARIVVHEHGNGMPVLLLHGSPDTHAMWLPLMEHLQGGVRCIAPDLPGFGESTLPQDFPLTLDNMADFVRNLLAAMEVNEPAVLITTDFGAHYGLAALVKYPHLVRGIAISNTSFFQDYEWHFFAKLYRMPLVGELLMATASRSVLEKTLRKVAPALPDSYIDDSYGTGFGSSYVRKTILRMYRERSSRDFSGWEEKLMEILQRKPALVLWGDRDPFISPAYAERWGAATVRHFPEFSHWLPVEAPAEYAAALMPWLRSLPI